MRGAAGSWGADERLGITAAREGMALVLSREDWACCRCEYNQA